LTFPVLVSGTQGAVDFQTSVTVSLAPSNAGNFHVVAVGHDGSTENATMAGFNQLGYTGAPLTSLAIFYTTADGTETKVQFSVDGAQAEAIAWRSWVYSADGTFDTPILAMVSGTGTQPDPPSLTLSKDAVVIAVGGSRAASAGNSYTSSPAGYTNASTVSALGAAGVSLGWAHTSVSTTENPGTFQFDKNNDWVTATLGITISNETALLLRRQRAI